MEASFAQHFRQLEISPEQAGSVALRIRSWLSAPHDSAALLSEAVHLFRQCYGELQLNDLPAPSFHFKPPDLNQPEPEEEE